MDNDITLIKLQRPSEYAPIDLDQPGDNTWHEVGTNLVTAGWGILSAGGGTPDKAQHVTVPVVPDCADTNYGPSVGIEYNPETMVCAGTVGLDACQGDSGGPLFGVAPTGARTLVGIVSFGIGCAAAGFPGVYARVQSYTDWICSNTNGDVCPPPAPPSPVTAFKSNEEFRGAIDLCFVASPSGDCAWLFNNIPIGQWDVSAITDMSSLFRDKPSFNQDLSAWKVSAVTTMKRMFFNASSFDKDISAWNVSAVTTMSYMFFNASSFDKDISAWNVSAVRDMYGMFNRAASFNQDISAWDVSAVTRMMYMFRDASSFDKILCSDAWRASKSKATQTSMFLGSDGRIC